MDSGWKLVGHLLLGKLLETRDMNGEVLGIYVSAGGSKCSVVITDWLICVSDVSGLLLDDDLFLAVEFLLLFFFSLFFCSIGFQMVGNLNDIPLMWCLFSSD